MPLARRKRRTPDIWPGFVDALAQLLMVIIFLLLVFTAGQIYLSQALSGRDKLLDQLRHEVNSLGDMLSLERHANADLKLGSADLSARLKTALATGTTATPEIIGGLRKKDQTHTAQPPCIVQCSARVAQ